MEIFLSSPSYRWRFFYLPPPFLKEDCGETKPMPRAGFWVSSPLLFQRRGRGGLSNNVPTFLIFNVQCST